MRPNVVLVLAGLFWLGMNLLLWHAEFGQHRLLAGQMPVEIVWQKILTAQDSSPLEIRQHGKHVGFCRWTTTIQEAAPSPADEPAGSSPDGIVKRPIGYKIDLDGHAAVGEFTERLRFDCQARFDTNYNLRQFRLELRLLSARCEISANAAEETLQLTLDDGTGQVVGRKFRLSQLRDPELLQDQLLGPLSTERLGVAMLWPGLNRARALAAEFKATAQNDWLRIGQATIRVHKIEVQLPSRRRAIIYVSRVGEILRVELPGDLVLLNQQLPPLQYNRTGPQ